MKNGVFKCVKTRNMKDLKKRFKEDSKKIKPIIFENTYSFSKKDKVTKKQFQSFLDFKEFFLSLNDKTPLKDEILFLASYYL
jgi:hypothetical protein